MKAGIPAAPKRHWALQSADATLLLWFAYLLVAPTIGFGWIDSWHNEQRAVQIVLLSVTAFAFSVLAIARPDNLVGTARCAIAAGMFFGIGAVSSALSAHPYAGLAEIAHLALLAMSIALAATVTAADPNRAFLWARYCSMLIGAAYVLGVAVRLLAAVELGRGIDHDVLILGYANPRFPSALHAILIPFIAAVVLDGDESRRLRVAAVLVLAFLWAINWGLGTRGIWFAYLVGLPLAMVAVGWKEFKGFPLCLVSTATAGVVFMLLAVAVAAPTSAGVPLPPPTDNLTLTSREVLWQLGWQAIVGSPLLGIGPMQFAALDSSVGAHPHNWPLQIAAEWGIPALGVTLAVLWNFGASIRRSTENGSRIAAPALALSVSLCLGLVDGNLLMPVSQSAVALAAGLLIGTNTHLPKSPALPQWTVRSILVAAIIAVCMLATYAVDSFDRQGTSAAEFRSRHPGAWLVPRFWEQGSLP